eukprot:177062-Amphidinium_carterae.2
MNDQELNRDKKLQPPSQIPPPYMQQLKYRIVLALGMVYIKRNSGVFMFLPVQRFANENVLKENPIFECLDVEAFFYPQVLRSDAEEDLTATFTKVGEVTSLRIIKPEFAP